MRKHRPTISKSVFARDPILRPKIVENHIQKMAKKRYRQKRSFSGPNGGCLILLRFIRGLKSLIFRISRGYFGVTLGVYFWMFFFVVFSMRFALFVQEPTFHIMSQFIGPNAFFHFSVCRINRQKKH